MIVFMTVLEPCTLTFVPQAAFVPARAITTATSNRTRMCSRRRCSFSRHNLAGLSNRRQHEGKFAPLTELAAHRDRTAVTCDDAVHDGKPEAGAVADTFGREARLQDAVARSLIYDAA